jgi:sugar porter (SP) family MFS transporter
MVPVYLAEMAPAEHRGVITSLNQYMIIVGTALAGAIGFALAFAQAWRWMVLIGVLPGILLLIGILRVPDTPRSLIRRGQPDIGREVLAGLRGDRARAEREFAEIAELEQQERQARTTAARLSTPWVRRLLLLGVLLAIFQQITGINTIVYYAPTVLTSFGISPLTALLFTFLNGLLNIVTIAVIVQSKIVDRWGRKPTLLCGLAGMSVSLFLVGAGVLTFPAHSTGLFVITLIGFVLFTNTFSGTWGPVLWVVLAEIFPLAVRGTAMAIATLFNWLTDFFVSLTFPTLTALAGPGVVFIGYAILGVVIFPLVWFLIPETKQLSLESLETSFRSGHRTSTDRSLGNTP